MVDDEAVAGLVREVVKEDEARQVQGSTCEGEHEDASKCREDEGHQWL